MSEQIKYLEIDAQAGLAEINLTVSGLQIINIVVGEEGLGTDSGLKLGTNHNEAYYGDLGNIAYLHSQKPHTIIGEGEKKTGVDAGTLGQLSVTDDYLYICVKQGDSTTAVWKRIVLFQT